MDREDDGRTTHSTAMRRRRHDESYASKVSSQQLRYWRRSLWSAERLSVRMLKDVLSRGFLANHTQPWSILVHEPSSTSTESSQLRVNYIPTVVQPGVFFVRASREHVTRILSSRRRLGQISPSNNPIIASMPNLFDTSPFGVIDFQPTNDVARGGGTQWMARAGLDADEVACALRHAYDRHLLKHNVAGARSLPKLQVEDYATSNRPFIKMPMSMQLRYEHLWRTTPCGLWLSTPSLVMVWGDFWLQHAMLWYTLLLKSFRSSGEAEWAFKIMPWVRNVGERAKWMALNLLDAQALECDNSDSSTRSKRQYSVISTNVEFWRGYEALLHGWGAEICALAEWPEWTRKAPRLHDPRALIPCDEYFSKSYQYERAEVVGEPLNWIGLVRSVSYWMDDYDLFFLIESLWHLVREDDKDDSWRKSRVQTLSTRLTQWTQDTMELLRTMHTFDLRLHDDTLHLMNALRSAHVAVNKNATTRSSINDWSADVLVVRCARLALRQWQALISSFAMIWQMVVRDINEANNVDRNTINDVVQLLGERVNAIIDFGERHFPPIEDADDFGEEVNTSEEVMSSNSGEESVWSTRQREENEGGSDVYTYGASRGMHSLSQTADSLHRIRHRRRNRTLLNE